MKKLTALISVLALLLSLCACSGGSAGIPGEDVSKSPAASQAVSDPPGQNTDPVKTPALETNSPEQSSGESSSAPADETDAPGSGGEPSTEDLMAIALELSERRAPVSELYEAIGEPISSDYAPGCVEPGSEDGELVYDGFTVYTVRTADREYVYDVL